MSLPAYHFDWNEIAFGNRKPLNDLKAVFIAAPREISAARFTQLVKTYLPQGNIILGLAKEPYVLGLEDQPQFRMLQLQVIQGIITKVNASPAPHKVYTLSYFQRDTIYIFEKLKAKKVVLVNGSWKYAFHTQAPYYALASRTLPFDMVSPFTSEAEARAYETSLIDVISDTALSPVLNVGGSAAFTEHNMLQIASRAARLSYDYSFQTGTALGKKAGEGEYTVLATSCNKVVPYQTYAMHHGNTREKHFSPPHDLNHYDTVHAEVMLLITAQKERIGLRGTTLFINLMPCPACARMLSETDINEFVYVIDHSDGYAIHMLEQAGKKVRRLLPAAAAIGFDASAAPALEA